MDYCTNPNPFVPRGFTPKCGTICWTVGFRGDVRRVMCRGERDDMVSVCNLDLPRESKMYEDVCLESSLFPTAEEAEVFAAEQRKKPLTEWHKKVLEELYGAQEWKE